MKYLYVYTVCSKNCSKICPNTFWADYRANFWAKGPKKVLNCLPAHHLRQVDYGVVALVQDPPELGEVDRDDVVDGAVDVDDGGDGALEHEGVLDVDRQGVDGEGGGQILVLDQL